MEIHGFVFEEDTKPVDAHHLQVFSSIASLLSCLLPGFKKSYDTLD
jgi:hypothetical protein